MFCLQVLDYNIGLGKQLLPLVVQVLKYCTCPQLRHYFQQPPRCSLWALKPHIRQMWLKALLVILYKVLFYCIGSCTCSLVDDVNKPLRYFLDMPYKWLVYKVNMHIFVHFSTLTEIWMAVKWSSIWSISPSTHWMHSITAVAPMLQQDPSTVTTPT